MSRSEMEAEMDRSRPAKAARAWDKLPDLWGSTLLSDPDRPRYVVFRASIIYVTMRAMIVDTVSEQALFVWAHYAARTVRCLEQGRPIPRDWMAPPSVAAWPYGEIADQWGEIANGPPPS